jgi:hypothetical protein
VECRETTVGTHVVHRTNEVIEVIVINPGFAYERMGKMIGITSEEKEGNL